MNDGLKFLSMAEICDEADRLMKLPARDPESPTGFERDEDNCGWDIFWGGYLYHVSDRQTENPMALLAIIHQLGEKEWEGASSVRIANFISRVSHRNDWSLFAASSEPMARTSSDTQERAKLTPKLRYHVLIRDGFSCRACGASPETGAHLHIDHIKAISNGGLTEAENLQALCSACNFGKGSQ